MENDNAVNKDTELPPRPGEIKPEEKNKNIKGTAFIIYINGEPVTMSKMEALKAMEQIIDILRYLDQWEVENNG
jgi:hypothetical protein